jgi:hypothetical protein
MTDGVSNCNYFKAGWDFRDGQEVLDVEWDDDCIRYVHQQRCQCGRFWTMKDYHRRSGMDIIECQCPECNVRREFAFRPRKIHTSVTELIQQNRQWVRT